MSRQRHGGGTNSSNHANSTTTNSTKQDILTESPLFWAAAIPWTSLILGTLIATTHRGIGGDTFKFAKDLDGAVKFRRQRMDKTPPASRTSWLLTKCSLYVFGAFMRAIAGLIAGLSKNSSFSLWRTLSWRYHSFTFFIVEILPTSVLVDPIDHHWLFRAILGGLVAYSKAHTVLGLLVSVSLAHISPVTAFFHFLHAFAVLEGSLIGRLTVAHLTQLLPLPKAIKFQPSSPSMIVTSFSTLLVGFSVVFLTAASHTMKTVGDVLVGHSKYLQAFMVSPDLMNEATFVASVLSYLSVLIVLLFVFYKECLRGIIDLRRERVAKDAYGQKNKKD